MNDEDREYIDRTIDAIHEGWCKGKARDVDGNFCMIGAATRVGDRLHMYVGGYQRWCGRVQETIRDLFPDRVGNIPYFNDHPATTKEDVLLVLKHAREMD